MKYNTISTTSLAKEERKSMLTNKKETDDKMMTDSHEDIQTIKNELELVQKALKSQTRRCRQLVTEYTRRLRLKEQQYHSEKTLREDQLAKVLRALLIFEARLRQEQKIISHQLEEKDAIIKKQSNHIKSILSSQYCKNCKQYYSSSPNLESLDSSSEYVTTDYQYHGYQSSNFESLDSSSEIYATISEKSYKNVNSGDDNESKVESDSLKYQRNKDVERKTNKLPHRKSVGTYFEVLKMRNDDKSSCSNDDNDNTSNDYENLDSLPNEGVTGDITVVSERIKNIFQKSDEASLQVLVSTGGSTSDSSLNLSVSDCHTTVNQTNETTMKGEGTNKETDIVEEEEEEESPVPNKSENISNSMPVPVFEGDTETNEKWYVSTSDQEDEQQREIYRNNPVLECVNQILLQSMNDNLNSPPKTPAIERKCLKNKKVKFSDEEDNKPLESSDDKSCKSQNYYETPIQKAPHHYETPQSIYSNDYEQILSKCSSDGIASVSVSPTKLKLQDTKYVNNLAPKLSLPKPKEAKEDPYYIDMINKEDKKEGNTSRVIRKKMLRTPPALPPKPANLISKHKITLENKLSRQCSIENLLESEPDYCSISELNLPLTAGKRISVVAEINPLDSNDVKSKLEKKKNEAIYDPVISSNDSSKLLVSKKMEKLNIQTAKQTTIKSEPVQIPVPEPVPVAVSVNPKSPKNKEPDIPKLPQVSEIIIPEETEEEKDEEVINNDNYVKNNTQIKKTKPVAEPRRSIAIGSSVSSLITGFNNRQIINEVTRKPPQKLESKLFSSFDNHQNFDKHSSQQKFDDFDLSQNFEEFKLDDCEIEEYNVDLEDFGEEEMHMSEEKSLEPEKDNRDLIEDLEAPVAALTPIPAPTPGLSKNSIEFLKKQLQLQGNASNSFDDKTFQESPKKANEPSYEHFLECTGLSSKSILTPSRLISNHKNMLKPKDVKLRSKVKANLMERHNLGTITTTKYWSEPYL